MIYVVADKLFPVSVDVLALTETVIIIFYIKVKCFLTIGECVNSNHYFAKKTQNNYFL